MIDTGTLNSINISYDWYIQIYGGLNVSVTADGYCDDIYHAALIKSGTWSGIEMSAPDLTTGAAPPYTLSFSVMDPDRLFDPKDMVGKEATVRLGVSNFSVRKWAMRVKSAVYSYGEIKITCEDYWEKYLDKDFPATPLISSIEASSNAQHAGGDDDTACVPFVFGTAYNALRSVWASAYGARLFPLGKNKPGYPYVVDRVATPIELEGSGYYDSASYTLNVVTSEGIDYLQPYIAGPEGSRTPGFFQRGGQLLDMPVKYAHNPQPTAELTPGYLFNEMMTHLGCPTSKIDMEKADTYHVQYALIWMFCGVAYTRVRSFRDVLAQLLVCTNSRLKRTDKIWIEPIFDVNVITIDRNRIVNATGDEICQLNETFTFSPEINSEEYDGGAVAFWPDMQCGDPVRLEVGTIDSSSNHSSETLEIPIIGDHQATQRVARVHYQRRYYRVGQVSFTASFDLLGIEAGDQFLVNDPTLYGDPMTCIVTSVKIEPDVTVTIQADAYWETKHPDSIATWHPPAYNPLTSGGITVPTPLSLPICNTSTPTEFDHLLTVDGQYIDFWYNGNLWRRVRLSGSITSKQITGV